MGGSAAQVWNNVTEAARETVEDAPDKLRKYSGELENDIGRTALAVSTAGGSEAIRETGIAVDQKMKEEALRNAPKAGDLPIKPTPTMPGQTPPNDGKAPPEDKIKETGDEQRRARGRASTILTGRRGVSGDAVTARRTLLGV
jgi:hypothetical protein